LYQGTKTLRVLTCAHIPLKVANSFVSELHRHHKAAAGHRFSLGAFDPLGVLHGVAIMGRPVSRHRQADDPLLIEISRLCTDETANAPSLLLAAAARAAATLGYRRIATYTLVDESGASLRAAGFTCFGERGGGSWNSPSRPRHDKHPTSPKLLWEKPLRPANDNRAPASKRRHQE
jgi:hypothetical protein